MSLSRMQLSLLTYLVALATVFQKSAGELISVPRDTESKVRETTYFNCSTDHLSEEIFWYHGNKYIYTGSVIFEPYDKRFQIDRNASNGTHNLIIHSVEPGDAGEYSCIDEDGSGTRKSAQLIVLDGDPHCQSNIRPDGVIGQNIFNITPDEVQLSCNVIYYGNVPPQMEWKKVGENSSIKDNVTSNVEPINRYTYTLKFKGDVSLDKSSYVCQTTRSRNDQYNCSSENINVLYFIGGVMIQVNISRGDELTCNTTNNTFSCTKQWYHGDNTCPLSCGETFTTHLLGEYLCTAKCRIRGKDYDFNALKAFVFEETTTPSPSWGKTATAVLASITLLILVVIIASSVAIYKKRKAYERKLKRYVEDQSLEDLLARRPLFKTEDLERITENVIEEELKLRGKLKKETDDKAILGVAILGEELYVVRERSSKLEVYGCNTLALQRKLAKLNDLVTAVDICSCKKNTCLYIMDKKIGPVDKDILKIDTQGKLIKKWHTRNNADGYLSTTEEGNVIITVQEEQLLLEYSQDGSLRQVINLSECINLWHAIKLHNDRFIVSHGMLFDRFHRVCLVDKNGNVQKSFGREVGSAVDQLNMPFYLAVGSSGFVVVADLFNNRVLLLDSNLEFKVKIVPRYRQRFLNPRRVYLDETKGLLIVVITAGTPTNRIPEEADNTVQETEEGGSLPESKGILNQRGKENEVDVSNKIEEDCRILAFDIKPVLTKYKLTVEDGCAEEKEESDLLA